MLLLASHFPREMSADEVLAVEIKRFRGESVQTVVPRVIGRTAASAGPSRSGQRLSRDSFLDGFADEDVRGVAERLLDAAAESGGEISHGGSFGLSVRVKCSLRPQPVSVGWLYSEPGKGWMSTRDFSFGAERCSNRGAGIWLRSRSPRTRQARASRHGRSGTKRPSGMRTIWSRGFVA